MIQSCCESVFPHSGRTASLSYSSVVFAELACVSICQRLFYMIFTMWDAFGSDDLFRLYTSAAIATVKSIHLGGLGSW